MKENKVCVYTWFQVQDGYWTYLIINKYHLRVVEISATIQDHYYSLTMKTIDLKQKNNMLKFITWNDCA